MNFDNQKPIFLQIAQAMEEKILLKDWPNEERIPSVRDLAASFKVNPNTVMRSYNTLQDLGLLENKRGVGYFTTSNAYETLKKMKKEQFIKQSLPKLVKNLNQLEIPISELIKELKKYENK